jgi:hypothetical protein
MRGPGLRELLLTLSLALAAPQASASASTPDAPGGELGDRPAFRLPEPVADDAQDACGHSPQAQRLAELIRHHPLQRRLRLSCHPLLAEAARAKAEEMAARDQVSHIYGVLAPNRRLRSAGYMLPADYPGAYHNQVEAVAGGYATAEEALQGFLDSPPHRMHLLAEHPFYAEQDEIAVGYARKRDSDYIDFWVVFIARRADSGNPPVLLQADSGTPTKAN